MDGFGPGSRVCSSQQIQPVGYQPPKCSALQKAPSGKRGVGVSLMRDPCRSSCLMVLSGYMRNICCSAHKTKMVPLAYDLSTRDERDLQSPSTGKVANGKPANVDE